MFFLRKRGPRSLKIKPPRRESIILKISIFSFTLVVLTPQDVPKTRQDVPRRPQDAPRRPQDAPKTAQDAPKTPQDAPRGAQNGPRRPQDAPKTPQNILKTAPRCPKRAPTSIFYGFVHRFWIDFSFPSVRFLEKDSAQRAAARTPKGINI